MRLRTWPFLSLGFGALVLLTALSVATLHERMGRAYGQMASIQLSQRQTRDLLDRVRSELYLVAILVRDYLLESSSEAAATDREELEKLRDSIEKQLPVLNQTVTAEHLEKAKGLQDAIVNYWRSMDPIFDWTPEEKAVRGRAFLRRSVLPYRDAVLAAAADMRDVNMRQTYRRQREVLGTLERVQADLRKVGGLVLLLGAVVGIVSVFRTRTLEAAAAKHLAQIEQGAEELRLLTQKLSNAQEEERKSLSRELHDQVGQTLTALRMELTNLEEFRNAPGGEFPQHLAEAKKLAEETLRTVRTMSAGLRPSVLDELGLAPALQWQARRFAQHCGVPVEMELDGELGDLPESYRTCIYRVVQEALTNSARHSGAKTIRVTLHGGEDVLALTVEDDGAGFDVPHARGRGLGLLGIEERVRELNGHVQFVSQPSKGTLLRCDIPAPKKVAV